MRPPALLLALLLLQPTTGLGKLQPRRTQPRAPTAARAKQPRAHSVTGGAAAATPTLADAVIAGTLASIAGDISLHPVDTVKTVCQATGTGIFEAMGTVGANGPLAFYDGVVPYMIGDGLSGAVKFGIYEKTKEWCANHLPQSWIGISRFACAAVAFLVCSVILVPAELVKQRIQAGVYPNMIAGALMIARDEGLRGCFTGYRATLFRDVPYTVLELGIYDWFKGIVGRARRRWTSSKALVVPGDELVAAAVTGGAIGWATNPLDVVKTRMMVDASAAATPLAVLKSVWKNEGAGALLAGSAARVLWLAPFTVIYFGVYEQLKRYLAERRLAA